MIVLVTGATGFLGRALMRQLLERLGPGDEVRVLVRTPEVWADRRVVPVPGTLEEVAAWQPKLQGCEHLFHLAADATFGQGSHYEAVNVEPVRRMVAALQAQGGTCHFVFVSSVGAVDRAPGDRVTVPLNSASVPHPTSDYGKSKLAAEKVVRDSGLPFTIVRPGWIYGAGMRRASHLNVLAQKVAQKPGFARLGFPGRVPLIFADDLAQALVNSAFAPQVRNRTWFAVTENRSLGEVLAALHHQLHGGPLRQVKLPRLGAIVGRLHARLPLALNNLFVDYLAATDDDFRSLLLPQRPVMWEQGSATVTQRYSRAGGWWLVTGANSGIGRALVTALLAQRRPVVAVDKVVDALEPGEKLRVVAADLTSTQQLEQLVAEVASLNLAGLVNNAGVGFRGGLMELPWAKTELTVQVNVLGTLRLTHLLREQLLRDRTTIVNIASNVAYHPLPHMSVYAASKAFLLSWSLALSQELRATNQVVTFSPAGTRTNFQKESGVAGAQGADLLEPAEVAAQILKAASAGRRHTLLGLKSRAIVGLSNVLPVGVKLSLWNRLFSAKR